MLNFAPVRQIELRPYQADAIEALRQAVREGRRRTILCAPTGAGKTVLASQLLREADRKGSYALFVVDRIALVDQTSAVLDGYGIRHGVMQGANHPRWSPRENVQVCSAQTLARRSLPRAPSLIVVDEAHCRMAATMDLIERNPQAVAIGLTATPFTRGMGRDWQGMVTARTTRALIRDGHLVEPVIYVGRAPDDSEYSVNGLGEFSERSAEAAGVRIIGDVVAEWQRRTRQHFGGPVRTIVFAPTVEYGRELCAAFAAAGYNFQQISYLDGDDTDRAARIALFRQPDGGIDGLVSCAVLTKGFDVPGVLCGISCRPYRKSLSSHIQEVGRVMRPSPDGRRPIWLCHAGNMERFAADMIDVWDNGPGDLDAAERRDAKPRERTAETREAARCRECDGLMSRNVCLACGWERPPRSGIETVAGETVELDTARLSLRPRDGLRAACLADPRKLWDAALVYTATYGRHGDTSSRRWAAGIWRGIYPGQSIPAGWYRAPVPATCDFGALGLVEREVKRFRRLRRAAA